VHVHGMLHVAVTREPPPPPLGLIDATRSETHSCCT
jgi:hypothetical protein